MDTKSSILFTLTIVCWTVASTAQYVPRTKRSKNTSQNVEDKTLKIPSIYIKKGEEFIVPKTVLLCDSLIMEDKATLKAAASLKSLMIYANYCKIGNQCVISTRGRDGQQNTQVPVRGEPGADAAKVNLHLNIYALGSLTIDARGGNGGNGQIPGIYGAGGHVNIAYYAPFVVNISKKKARRRKKAVIVVRNKKGRMNLYKLRKLRDQEESNLMDGNNKLVRVRRQVNPKTKKTTIITHKQDNSIRQPPTPKNFGKYGNMVSETEKERLKKKDGTLSFKRLKDPMRPKAIKF
ncbi:MAG TPA: hypothetical protein DCS93_01125 [Microscillaceae bacterium]|nr:hypothetical protein [Microscillaceae bacterium]